MQSLRGVAVVVPTVDREISGSTPGRYNLHIKITSKLLILWTVTPSLVEAFHAAFYSPPHRRLTRPFIILSACPFFDGCLIRYDTPRMLCTSWGTQAIDYSWASLDTFHAAHTSSARIQDVDVILI